MRFPKLGAYLIGGFYEKDYGTWGSTLGSFLVLVPRMCDL